MSFSQHESIGGCVLLNDITVGGGETTNTISGGGVKRSPARFTNLGIPFGYYVFNSRTEKRPTTTTTNKHKESDEEEGRVINDNIFDILFNNMVVPYNKSATQKHTKTHKKNHRR
jgi:hypothetical protein